MELALGLWVLFYLAGRIESLVGATCQHLICTKYKGRFLNYTGLSEGYKISMLRSLKRVVMRSEGKVKSLKRQTRGFMKMKRPTLATTHQVEEILGLRVVHKPTHDWPYRRRGRKPIKKRDTIGNYFNSRDEKSMQINSGKPFREFEAHVKKLPPKSVK